MKEHIDVAGLLGFSVSGLLFVTSAIRAGDTFALAGSIVWVLSCIAWITALIAARRS